MNATFRTDSCTYCYDKTPVRVRVTTDINGNEFAGCETHDLLAARDREASNFKARQDDRARPILVARVQETDLEYVYAVEERLGPDRAWRAVALGDNLIAKTLNGARYLARKLKTNNSAAEVRIVRYMPTDIMD